jgi:hypothetical protein
MRPTPPDALRGAAKKGAMVGLEFWVRFRRPIYADETIRLEWLVVK